MASLVWSSLTPVDKSVFLTSGTVGLAPTKTPEDWFNTVTMEGLTAEFDSWKENDDLLQASLDMKDEFFWHSHTLSHQARDNLGQVDCESEDGGKNNTRQTRAREVCSTLVDSKETKNCMCEMNGKIFTLILLPR